MWPAWCYVAAAIITTDLTFACLLGTIIHRLNPIDERPLSDGLN